MNRREMRLPEPPRRAMVAAGGNLVLEFEAGIAQVRFDSQSLEGRAIPAAPGECLVGPQGEDRCVLLAPGGTLKVCAGRTTLHARPGALYADDEPVDAWFAPGGRFVLQVGRRVGDELLLPVPEFRFVTFDAALERIGVDGPVAGSRPRWWGIDGPTGAVLAAHPGPEGAGFVIRCIDLLRGTESLLPLAPEFAGRDLTGLGVEPASGHLLVATADSRESVLWLWSPRVGRCAAVVTAPAADGIVDPRWSPGAVRILFTRRSAGRATLFVMQAGSTLCQPVCAVPEGAQALWVDDATIAVLAWDELDWFRL